MMQENTEQIRLREVLCSTPLWGVLSAYGQRCYFPNGIVEQSNQAAQEAGEANATAGVALKQARHMTLSYLQDAVGIDTDKLVAYAPTAGDPMLRQAWKRLLIKHNPSIQDKNFSLPVVTSGLTHALSLAADLFIDVDDTLILYEPCWDNYRLMFEQRYRAAVRGLPLFRNDALNIEGLASELAACDRQKIVVLLNFPHNPTGYTPELEEQHALVQALVTCAKHGRHIVVLIDDAYFGLFHNASAARESIFAMLCDAHEHIIALKCDAATKESLVWGFRIGFITYGYRGITQEATAAMEQKLKGAVRSSISSCSRIGQTLLLQALGDERYEHDVRLVHQEMALRYELMQSALQSHIHQWDLLRPLPSNSGYFVTLQCTYDTEQLRLHLLKKHAIGTVSLYPCYLRIAYSGLDRQKIDAFVDTVYQGACELWR